MSSFTEMEMNRLAAEKAASKQDAMTCPKCGSEWFTLKSYCKYRADFPVAPGDHPAVVTGSSLFCVLECLCGELFEVKSMRVNLGKLEKEYDKFLDQVEKSTKIKESK